MYFKFKSKILKGLIGNSVHINDKLIVHGFTAGKGFGTTALTFLVKKAFNIHRFPLWEDRHFTEEFNRKNTYATLDNIIQHDEFINSIDEMVEEIKEIYTTTQTKLNIQYPNQSHVKLYRSLDHEYGVILLQMKEEASKNGNSYIEIGTDILNSFTDNRGKYGMIAKITIDVPKEDILYYDELFNDIMEYDEFVVMNRRMDGLLKIPIDCIRKSVNSFDIYDNSWYSKHMHQIFGVKKYNGKHNFINLSSCIHIKFFKLNTNRKKDGFIKKVLKKLAQCGT
ncbi:hypothetical protein [Arcobacter sp. F2176]|uniref:hypothetical protein n=1 Tax=Arcobacter sp. F2176 TaxID=2044511 RepID=UPI00100B6941|nr:hypothetical protein [Arcobacter sp. F2176]RXJ79341.1 hypothetical protein CRU95_14480 [Arcobacter sp. F2176]